MFRNVGAQRGDGNANRLFLGKVDPVDAFLQDAPILEERTSLIVAADKEIHLTGGAAQSTLPERSPRNRRDDDAVGRTLPVAARRRE